MEEENRKLYPLRFLVDRVQEPWGEIDYHIADLGFKDSMVDNGWFGGNTLSELMGTFLERVVGDDAFEFYGLQFPLMLRTLDVRAWMPLRVNVPDDIAEERYDSFGKTALWYVEEAAPGAELVLGFNRTVEPAEFYAMCQDGTVRDVLNIVRPKKGDCFFLKPGTVYAAGPGLKVVEIAESSELSLNLNDLGASLPDPQEILLEEAFDLIDFNEYAPVAAPEGKLAACPEFVVTKLDLKDGLRIFSDQPGSFAIYHCVGGEAQIRTSLDGKSEETYSLKEDQTLLVPSEMNDFYVLPLRQGTVLLEALVERRTVTDSYTNQQVAPGSLIEPEMPDPHLKEWN